MSQILTVMSRRTGTIGYYTGSGWDDNVLNAKQGMDKKTLSKLLVEFNSSLPKHWVIGVLDLPDEKVKKNPSKRRVKKNPVPASKYVKVKQAIELFKDFTGMDPEHLDEYIVDHPDVSLAIGTLDAVSYTTVREGKTELYEHKFKKKSRPLLCCSHDGKQLVILGGEYTFTERGITDKG